MDQPQAVSPNAVVEIKTPTGAPVRIGNGEKLSIIAGPCQMESRQHALETAHALKEMADRLGIGLIYKTSYDKANRTSANAQRGIGLHDSLPIFQEIREVTGLPTLTDVHETSHCPIVAEAVDVIQIPAFLCRQTDLVAAAAATGRPLHLKKGQFMAPEAMGPAAAKAAGAPGVLLTERGASFGYGDLVVDLRSLPRMRALGHPVGLDATHGVQRPAAGGPVSGGDRGLVPALARAGVAVGLDALFLEVHDDPDAALSDGPNALPLAWLPGLLGQLVAIARALEPA